MHKSLQLLGILAVLAMPFAATPAHAERYNSGAKYDSGTNYDSDGAYENDSADSSGIVLTKGDMSSRHRQGKKNQNLAMDQNRMEWERIENERDRLKLRCMNTKGQDRSACNEQMSALDVRQKALNNPSAGMDSQQASQEHRHEGKKKEGKWKAKHKKQGKKSKAYDANEE